MAYTHRFADDTLTEPHRIPSGVFFTEDICPQLPLDCPPASFFPTFPNARPAFNPVTVLPAVIPSSLPPPQYRIQSQKVLCLPLLDVAIDVRVDATIATTRFMQRYSNISDVAIPEAHYTFPMYDGAAVTTFRYYIGNSQVLIGKVLSNEEARLEYMRAIENMEAAALLEEKTPEVFQTLIGSIPPKTSIRIEITYVSKLKPDIGGQGYLVTIPTSLAPRYGMPPTGFSSSSTIVHTGLAIVVAVNALQPIRQIECRSHPVSVEMGSAGVPSDMVDFDAFYAQASSSRGGGSAALNPRQATVRLSDSSAGMDKDFVVFIKTSRDDDSVTQSQALLSPANEYGHSALMVTIQPSELFSAYKPQMIFSDEIVFIADRSGSMEGEKIAGLRDALNVFLKSLPDTCSFNLYSFGDRCESLWKSSMPYSQGTLDEAVSHVSGFTANMGGTELLPALKNAVERRSRTGHSTQIIVLTDGQVWNANETIKFVQSTRSKLEDKFRLFVLGIGDNVSHRIIEGISGVGGGFGEVVGVATPEKWQNRVVRMLKGAMMPPTWTCEIDLGSISTRLDLKVESFASHTKNDQRSTLHTLDYIQAPYSPSIHHFKQSSIFFLLKIGSTAPLSAINIVATTGANGGNVITASLPVLPTMTPDKTLQHLTVKSALLDLEIRADQQPHDTAEESIASRNAVFLGKLYSVTSRWTSFVATNRDESMAHVINSYNAIASDLQLLTAPSTHSSYNPPLMGASNAAQGPQQRVAGSTLGYDSDCGYSFPVAFVIASGRRVGYNSTFFEASSDSYSMPKAKMRGERLPRSRQASLFPPQLQSTAANGAPAKRTIDVNDIVDSQMASGRFKLSSHVREKLASDLPTGTREAIQVRMTEHYKNDNHDEEVVDTLMMAKYIETKLTDKKELLELVVNKANKSADVAWSEGVKGDNSSANTTAQQKENTDELDSDDELEDIKK